MNGRSAINLIKVHHLRKQYEKHYKQSEENGDFDTDFATAKDMLDTLECLWKRFNIANDALKDIKRHVEIIMPTGYKFISDWKMADEAIRKIKAVPEVVE